jgi:NAD(P)H-hydrate epimerase
MKILTAAQMRDVDRRTIEAGIPGIILMENAAHRVVEFLRERFTPLSGHRIVVFCGKGNNGGDGLAIARLLHIVEKPHSLHVLLASGPEELKGDAAANFHMLEAAGLHPEFEITEEMRRATLVVDALLGTGLAGPARGRPLEWIREMNSGFADARVVAVDVPSGMESDRPDSGGEVARATATVTFTAPKICHALAPACDRIGEVRVVPIGSPVAMIERDASLFLSLAEPAMFRHLFRPRPRESNKGAYGHVLAVAGARGKSGAAAMTGLAALRSGAGLVTVASAESAIAAIASHAAELMTEPLPETPEGSISPAAFEKQTMEAALARKNVVASGPGLGMHPDTVHFLRRLVEKTALPMVLDADALNALAGSEIPTPAPRVLTPHPGEMARLAKISIPQVQGDRVNVARRFAQQHGVWLVLKGNRSLIASPAGQVCVNPTGSPAMSTGGSGDILTGIIAGLLAQFPEEIMAVLVASVWIHGRAGELAAAALGEKAVIAGDLLRFLPEAMSEHADVSHHV